MEIDANQGGNGSNRGPLFTSAEPVTVLGGGALGPRDLALALERAPHLIAADGGAGAALAAGAVPRAVIGDMDSLGDEARAALPASILHRIAEQDSTDFDKVLRSVEAPLTLAVGFTGDRIDHELAVYHTLIARPGRRCIVIGATDILFHAPPAMTLTLDLAAGTRLSLFPLDAVTGASEGLEWPIDDLSFHPARCIGTSNAAAGAPVRLRFDAAGMLVILPRADLDVAIRALSG